MTCTRLVAIATGLTVLSVALSAVPASADVSLAAPFSDHMVLQRSMAVPVWGTAGDGEEVTVTFRGQSKTATAGTDGKWSVKLDSTASGGPFTLIAAAKGKNTVTIADVMVGEVWLASGQSNMEFDMNGLAAANLDSAKAADFPILRLMNFRGSGKWAVCAPGTALYFSATAYYFGRDLQQALKIPVGIVSSAVGGTEIERWLDPATLAADPLLKNDTTTGDLYRQYIAPLAPMAMKGAIWYQGESNATATNGNHPNWIGTYYRSRFQNLILGWRKVWGQGDFAFHFVQLANFMAAQTDPGETSAWADLRESQRLDLVVPNTAMAVIIDIGDAGDIHPKDKWDVGKRLALPALAKIYGQKDLVWSGPMYQSMLVKGNAARLVFGYADGMTARGASTAPGTKLKGFAIAGADKKWYWADATISKDTVIVSSASVAAPIMVRYGYANNPDCNLVNAAGLPASPFKTDGAQLPIPTPVEQQFARRAAPSPLLPIDAGPRADMLGRLEQASRPASAKATRILLERNLGRNQDR